MRSLAAKAKEVHQTTQDIMERSRMRIYDNGGKTLDRYTVLFMDQPENQKGIFAGLGMSADPFAPNGFGQHITGMPGRHLGKRISETDLPVDCRKMLDSEFNLTLDQLKYELRLNDVKGDPWGVSVSCFFELCTVLYEKGDVPSEWEYRPGAGGNYIDNDGYFAPLFMECTVECLLELGNYLFRLTRAVENAGLSY